jgi:amidophosphoribosyltransferase
MLSTKLTSTSLRPNLQKTKCGILGIFSPHNKVSKDLHDGLLMLQHRGQDSAGIVTTDWEHSVCYKDKGRLDEVFVDKEIMNWLNGTAGIGHVRYPTTDGHSYENVQPFNIKSIKDIHLVHNGNIINKEEIIEDIKTLGMKKYINELKTTSDSELLTAYFGCIMEYETLKQRGFMRKNSVDIDVVVYKTIERIYEKVKGSYSCLVLIQDYGMVAFRDPHGIRPLVLGMRKGKTGSDEYCISSEDCAFAPIDFRRVRDIKPGEIYTIRQDGRDFSSIMTYKSHYPCLFEYIYLARPDSTLNDISVYEFQMELGRYLAQRIKNEKKDWDYELVVPVPDSSRPSALKLATELDIRYREGLVKNRYVGRTFIMPDQDTRENAVKRKLNAIPSIVKGKNILLVDDSIVRGTTMKKIIAILRQAGANKVYVVSASPPVRYANIYGHDIPTQEELIAHDRTEEEIRKELGADGLIYQNFDDIDKIRSKLNPSIEHFEMSCFNGRYINNDKDYLV